MDEFDLNFVNINIKCKTNDQYILTAQCQQVCYIEDAIYMNLHIVIKTKPMDVFDEISDISNLDVDNHNLSNIHMIPVDQNWDWVGYDEDDIIFHAWYVCLSSHNKYLHI